MNRFLQWLCFWRKTERRRITRKHYTESIHEFDLWRWTNSDEGKRVADHNANQWRKMKGDRN